MENDFYLYAYLDPLKIGNYEYHDLLFENEPFYIGKGKKNRMFVHLKKGIGINEDCKNSIFYKKIKELHQIKNPPIIIKIKDNLNEDEAFLLEKEYIKKIGRKIKNEGPLYNLTIGGNGFKGCNSYRGGFKKNHSEETKRKLSEVNKGRTFEDKVGIEKAEKWKKNMSKSLKGKKVMSEKELDRIKNLWLGKKIPMDIRKKMSEGRIGISPPNKGKIIYQYTLEMNFLREIFLYEIPENFNVQCSNVIKCCKGERKSAGGYIWKYNKE